MTRPNAPPGSVTIVSNHGSFSGAPENLAAHIAALNRSHRQEPPGSAILRQKLARAEAVAPEQRKDEETAFIESVALMRAICQDLPLTDAGEPQLPATPATRQRVLLAMLAAARCHYICPAQPFSDANWEMHLAAYEALFDEQELTCCRGAGSSGSGSNGSGNAASADATPLSGLIRVFTQAANSGGYVQLAWRAAGWMGEAANWPAVRRQLAQLAAAAPSLGGQLPGLLAGAALPPLQQLRYTLWLMVFEMANGVLGTCVTQEHGMGLANTQSPELTPAQQQVVELAEHQAAAMLVQLEPDSPRSHFFAGDFAATHGDPAASAQHLRRCIKLAHALPSRYWRMRAATALLSLSAMQLGARSPQTRALMEHAIEEFQRAQKKVDVCKKRLPQRWSEDIAASLEQLAPLVEAGRAQLRGDPGAGPQAAVRLIQEHIMQSGGIPDLCRCDGCGVSAAGLRTCTGCRTAKYCSPECQRQTWPAHKKACKAAQAAAAAAAAANSQS